jgi:hypothetical protein
MPTLRTIVLTLAALTIAPPVAFMAEIALTDGSAPEIAGDESMRIGIPSVDWSARLRREFPPGTPEQSMVTSLAAQGFVVDSQAREATYTWKRFPCLYSLSVRWNVGPTREVEVIEGGYTNACP